MWTVTVMDTDVPAAFYFVWSFLVYEIQINAFSKATYTPAIV